MRRLNNYIIDKFFLFCFIIFLILIKSTPCSALEENIITDVTVPIIDNKDVEARNIAIENGLKDALKKLVESLLKSKKIEENYDKLNSNIYQKSSKYLKSYKIKSEEILDDSYWISLEVEFNKELLKDDLVLLGLLKNEESKKVKNIVLSINDIPSYTSFKQFKEYLQNDIPGVLNVSYYSFGKNSAALNLDFNNSAKKLAEYLSYGQFNDFLIIIDSVSNGSISLSLMKK